MADPPVSSLLMYTPDDIDFSSLSDDTLRALALEIDPFIAGPALSELASRSPQAALAVARELLTGTDDPWLRASAFELVLDDDPAEAIGWAAAIASRLDDQELGLLARVLVRDRSWPRAPAATDLVATLEQRLGDPGADIDRRVVERALATYRETR